MAVTEHYSIRDVELLTGITAFKLRAWEKRYNGLLPHRTETNIRYYDGDQLRKLLNVATLVSAGHKVSKIMALEDARLHELVAKIADEASEEGLEIHVNNLIAAMLGFDEMTFDRILSSMIIRLGFYEAMLRVIYPFLRKTGVLWSTSNTSPAQEHFASNLLRRKIQASLDSLPCPVNTEKKFLLFLPPDEKHELGLLFTDYMIRSKGHATFYLGQDLPYDSLRLAAEHIGPTHVLTFFTAGIQVKDHIEAIRQATEGYKCQVLICTGIRYTELKLPRHISLLTEPSALFSYL
jgi:Predicted transcriptional regulators